MHLTIKNAETLHVAPASNGHFGEVEIDGVKVEDILIHIDIVTAIAYYGTTELLDKFINMQLIPFSTISFTSK